MATESPSSPRSIINESAFAARQIVLSLEAAKRHATVLVKTSDEASSYIVSTLKDQVLAALETSQMVSESLSKA